MLFVAGWGEHPEGGVAGLAVVERLDVFERGGLQLEPAWPGAGVQLAGGCRESGTFWEPRRVKGLMTDFDQFVAAHVDDLLRTAYLIVWDEGEAEDLVQECLLKVARRWPRIRRMEQPRAYARRILVNLALDGARGRAQRRGELEPARRRQA